MFPPEMKGRLLKTPFFAGIGLLFACVCLFLAPASALGITSSEALTKLNAQRAANGFPAAVAENSTWSHDCELQNLYEELNGNDEAALTHEENPGSPGYTEEGSWAAENSDLAYGLSWGANSPWATAPIHLDQLLAPRLSEVGVSVNGYFSCATTYPGWQAAPPSSNVVYSYPGNGVGGVAPSEDAIEVAPTPGEDVGIPAGTITGPYLYVFVDGPQLTGYGQAKAGISAASLTGPSGSVALSTVDNLTPGIKNALAPGGILIPRSPLSPNATYTAHVEGTVTPSKKASPYPFSYTWTFTTGENVASENGEGQSGLEKTVASLSAIAGTELVFDSNSPIPGKLTASRPATGAEIAAQTIYPNSALLLPLTPGTWKVCTSEPEGEYYSSWNGCIKDEVAAHPHLILGKAERSKGAWVAKLSVPHALLGKKLYVVEKLKHSRIYKRLLVPHNTVTKLSITGVKPNLLKIIATSTPFTTSDVHYDSGAASRLY